MTKEIAKILLRKHKTVAVAESCTGGLIAHTLTNISGSSKYLKLGLVLYSNEAKSKILNIKKSDIKRFGPVSREIAILMAKKVKSLAKTHIGLSATGIAGPTGGSKKKPVGTVYIALSYGNIISVSRCKFKGTRSQIKHKTRDKALRLIKQCLGN